MVVEVEAAAFLPDTGADGGCKLAHGRFRHLLRHDKTAEGHFSGDDRTGDRGGAGAPVGAENIAIDPEGACPEPLQIDDRPQTSSDEPLDLRAAPVELAAADVAGFPLQRRVGQHVVFRSEPAPRHALSLHPRRHARFQHGGADHAGFPEIHEDTAVGERGNVELKPDFAHGVGATSIDSIHIVVHLLRRSPLQAFTFAVAS